MQTGYDKSLEFLHRVAPLLGVLQAMPEEECGKITYCEGACQTSGSFFLTLFDKTSRSQDPLFLYSCISSVWWSWRKRSAFNMIKNFMCRWRTSWKKSASRTAARASLESTAYRRMNLNVRLPSAASLFTETFV